MSDLPRKVTDLIPKHFGEKQTRIIYKYWTCYITLDVEKATTGQILFAGRKILKISGLCHGNRDV